MPNNIVNYKPPRIVKGSRWYVEYYFRVPEELQADYHGKKWERFRVFEDINRHRTNEYADLLCKAVLYALENEMFNPFSKEKKFIADEQNEFKVKSWTAQQALLYFTQKWEERGLAPASIRKYKRTQVRFLDWLTLRNLEHDDITIITRKQIEVYLYEQKKTNAWENSSFNNEKMFLSTIFNFFVDQEMIKRNPLTDITVLKSNSKKHKFYDEDKFQLVRKKMQESDPLLFFASKLVYYLCIRSEKELKHLQLDNIFLERKQILIKAGESKTKMDRMIPIPDELFGELAGLKEKYPGSYYVISVLGKNKWVADNEPGPEKFGSGFLSKRFAKIRKDAKLSSDYTIFGMRHTRCVHLKIDGAPDQDIMNLMGHTDFSTTAKYLRDLGLQSDDGRISRLSRKF